MKHLTNEAVAKRLDNMKLSQKAQTFIGQTAFNNYAEMFGNLETAEQVEEFVSEYFVEDEEEKTMTNNNIFDMDSFGSDCPENWEEICDYLNSIATEETAEQIWEDFCRGDLKDAPKPNFYEYLIRDKEAGNIIAYFETLEEAEEELKAYEEEDRKEGTFTPGFYEIVAVDEI